MSSSLKRDNIFLFFFLFNKMHKMSGILGILQSLSLLGYIDADWASLHLSMRSTSGNCFFINGCLISWTSKKQRCVGVSTTESENAAASLATRELIWLQQMLTDIAFSSF